MTLVQTLVLGGLVAVWGWGLGRPLLQNVFNRARRDPVGHFTRQLSVLGQAPSRSLAHSSGRPARGNQAFGAPSARGGWAHQPARKRRLQVLMALVIAVVASGALAVFVGGLFLAQAGVLAGALVVYVGLAAVAGARESERGTKVRYLDASRTVEPARVRAASDR